MKRTSESWLSLLWLFLLWTPVSAQPRNPYALTQPGAYSEYRVLPQGKHREEIVENIPLPGGRKGYHSREQGPRGKDDCYYEMTPNGDLLRLKVIQPYGQLRLSPPLLSLPNLDRTKKWSSTSRCTFYSDRYPKGYELSVARQTGRVVGQETITVPAGTFKCLKVEVEFAGEAGTQWYARGVGMVKTKTASKEYLLVHYGTGHK